MSPDDYKKFLAQANASNNQIATQKKSGSGILGAILSTAGGALGGIAGSFVAPVAGTVAGGALGSAGGQALANLLTGNNVGDDVVQQGIFGAIPGVGGLLGKGAKILKGASTATRAGSAAADAGAAAVGALKPGGSILSRVGQGIENTGNGLMASQANLTRAAARNLGSSGVKVRDVFGSLQGRTGIGDIHKLTDLAGDITGREGVVSAGVNRSASAAGVDLTDLRHVANNALGDAAPAVIGAQKKGVQDHISNEISKLYGGESGSLSSVVGGRDALDASRRLADQASTYKQAFKRNGSVQDKQLGDVYSKISNTINDRLYTTDDAKYAFNTKGKPEILKTFEAGAKEAARSGNKELSTAYTKLGQEFRRVTNISEARTFQKDFVSLAKINEKTAEAENGAAASLAGTMTGLGKFAQRPLNIIAEPLNSQSGNVGAMLSNFGRRLQGTGGAAAGAATGEASKFTGKTVLKALAAQGVPRALLGGYGGGDVSAMDQEISPEMAGALQGGADVSNLSPDQIAAAGLTGAGGAAPAQLTDANGNPVQSAVPKENIDAAIIKAATAGDADNLKLLMSLSEYFYPSGADASKSSQSATTASATVDQLEQLLGKTGSQGNGVLANIVGGVQGVAGGAGLDDNARSYNAVAGSAASQIAKAVSGQSGALSDQDIKRAMDALPKLTDSDAVRKQKIASLRAQIAAAQSAGGAAAPASALSAVYGG